MSTSRASRLPKRVDRRSAGIECNGCERVFATQFAYDQHRRSGYLRGTACYAVPDTNRTNLYIHRRPDMSTAVWSGASRTALEVKCTTGEWKTRTCSFVHVAAYFVLECILNIFLHIEFLCHPAYPHAGRPGARNIFRQILHFLEKKPYKKCKSTYDAYYLTYSAYLHTKTGGVYMK